MLNQCIFVGRIKNINDNIISIETKPNNIIDVELSEITLKGVGCYLKPEVMVAVKCEAVKKDNKLVLKVERITCIGESKT